MIVCVVVDDNNGMSFNNRRQSQDRILRENILLECADKTSSLIVRNKEKKGIKSYKGERHPLPWEVFLKLSCLYYDSSYIHKPLYISLCLPLLEGVSIS